MLDMDHQKHCKCCRVSRLLGNTITYDEPVPDLPCLIIISDGKGPHPAYSAQLEDGSGPWMETGSASLMADTLDNNQ